MADRVALDTYLAELDAPHPDPDVQAGLDDLAARRLEVDNRPLGDGVVERTVRTLSYDVDGIPSGVVQRTTTVVTRPPDPAP